MTVVFEPVRLDAPLVNPAAGGLWQATAWQIDADGKPRWLMSGVEVRPFNYGGEASFAEWSADWCASEADLDPDSDVKRSAGRPEALDAFPALTVWAADECDLTEPSRAEVRTRAGHNLRLLEQKALEEHVAPRMLADAGAAVAVADIVEAVGALEDAFAETNTAGFIHARPGVAAVAARANLLVRTSGSGFRSPLGHLWVFGGGYVDTLGDTLVATSQPFGWRTEPMFKTASDVERGVFTAISERSMVVGYEAAVAAVEITP